MTDFPHDDQVYLDQLRTNPRIGRYTYVRNGEVTVIDVPPELPSRTYRLGLVVRWCAVGCACSVLAAAAIGWALR